MYFIYNILVAFFFPAIIIYWLAKVVRRKNYLLGLAERFGTRNWRGAMIAETGGNGILPRLSTDSPHGICFWVHAVSAGEVMGSIPLIKGLQTRFPCARVVLSTLTPTGRQMAREQCRNIDIVMYCPVDLSFIVERVISRIAPTVFLPVETDIWPTLIQRLRRRGVPCVLVNGRISRRRVRYRFLFKPVFRQMTFFCVQTEVDAERLGELGVERNKIAITGNMKFSQAVANSRTTPHSSRIHLPANAHLLIGGSTHESEEEQLLRCYRQLSSQRKDVYLLLAPRHLERLDHVEQLVGAAGFSSVRWSRLNGGIPAPVILLDTMGQLSEIYALAAMVFVGGSWVSRGGHNVMEPAAWGKPVFFGPHMENYSSAAATLVRAGAAMEVQNGEELAARLDHLFGRPEKLAEMGRNAKAFVLQNQGAVERNLEAIEAVLTAAGVLERSKSRQRAPLDDYLPAGTR